MLLALVLVPLLGALGAFVLPLGQRRPGLIPLIGTLHLALSLWLLGLPAAPTVGLWLALDPLGKLVLLQVSGIFFLCSLYAPGYLRLRSARDNRVFCTALLTFLGMMSLAILSRHLGLMWVALESSTLSAAPLLYFNNNPRSIEATWKYLLIGSVGIALALLGSFFLAYGALYAGLDSTLLVDDLLREAPKLSKPWLHGALVFLFIGYGTKMGLAPMHSWKPDAYGEAPGLAGTLLSGALTSCAFMAVLRFFHVADAAGEGDYARELLLALGLFSMAVASVFMVRQRDFKRMLAYSSVEHMGILAVGVGVGGGGLFGALYHMLTNGFTKGILFLSAGNIHRAFGSKRTDEVRGALQRAPISAGLLVLGFFAITGAPPFGPFVSELSILDAALNGGYRWVCGLFLLFLFVVFLGMGAAVLTITQGEPPPPGEGDVLGEAPGTWAPILGFVAVSLLLGLYLPAPLMGLLREATAYLEGK